MAVAELTLKLAKIYFNIAALDVPLRPFNCVNACLIIAEYFGWLLALLAFLFLFADEPLAAAFVFLPFDAALLVAEALCDVLRDDEPVVRSVIVLNY